MSTNSPELDALFSRDRSAVAAELLVAVFTPIVDKPYPFVTGARLGEALARTAGVKISTWSWSIHRTPDARLARLILELVLLWEKAGLACRGLAVDGNDVALLEFGERLVRAGDVGAVHRVMLA